MQSYFLPMENINHVNHLTIKSSHMFITMLKTYFAWFKTKWPPNKNYLKLINKIKHPGSLNMF